MDLGLKDKVFIVSGGSKGIGASIVRALAAEGAIPVIAGRSETVAKELAGELETAGKKSQVIACELASAENCKDIVSQVIQKWGRIDGVINNAGRNDGISLEAPVLEFEQSVQQNLFHYFYLAHFALPYLKESKGCILNISSKTALTGQGGTSGYAASKGAQLALTREWAVELLPYGIRVNAIVPAEVMTPLYESWIQTFENPEEKLQSIKNKIPLGKRMTTSEEIASMAVFLLSEKSNHTTGQWLFVDGGYVHLDRAIGT